MHSLFGRVKGPARVERRRIVFSEGDDPRVIAAAGRLRDEGLAEPLLVSKEQVRGLECVCPERSPRLAAYAAHYHARRAAKGVTAEMADAVARRNPYFA